MEKVNNITFQFNDKKYALEYLGDEYYKKYEFKPNLDSRNTIFPYVNCNFFALKCDEVFDYTEELHNFINNIINEEIVKGTYLSRITSIQPQEKYNVKIDRDFSVKEHPWSSYNCAQWSDKWFGGSYRYDNPKNMPVGFILPHLIVTNMETVPDNFFEHAPHLKKVTIKGDVKKIGKKSFYHCVSLEEVVFEEGIKEIGIAAFENSGLEEIRLPKSLEVLEDDALLFTNLRLLAVHSTLKKLGTQKLVIRREYNSTEQLIDGSESKKIVILYDENDVKTYTNRYDINTDYSYKVYRTIDDKTGDRHYCINGRTYTNAKKYDRLSEEYWHTEPAAFERALSLGRLFNAENKKYGFGNQYGDTYGSVLDSAKGWLFSSLSIIPERLSTNYSALIELNKKKNQCYALEQRIKEIENLKAKVVKMEEEITATSSIIENQIGTDSYSISGDGKLNTIVPVRFLNQNENTQRMDFNQPYLEVKARQKIK